MTSARRPICYGCVHFRTAFSCAAFPGGIPDEIVENGADHRTPYTGDGGVQFEPTDNRAAAYADDVFATEESDGTQDTPA